MADFFRVYFMWLRRLLFERDFNFVDIIVLIATMRIQNFIVSVVAMLVWFMLLSRPITNFFLTSNDRIQERG